MKKKLAALVTSLLMMSSVVTTAFAGDFAAVAHDHTHDDACLEIATEGLHIDVHDHTHDDACLETATEALHIGVHDHTHDDNCHDEEIVKTLESVEYNAPAQVDELLVVAATTKAHTCNFGIKYKTKAATCTATGYIIWKCTKCDKTTTETLPKIKHSYSTTTVQPTCTKYGYFHHVCTKCGYSYDSGSIPMIAHNYSNLINQVNATCTVNGYKTFKCSTCSATKDETIEKTGHSYSTTTVQPTCTKNGYFHHVCTKCGYSYNSGNIPMIAHNYSNLIKQVNATCTVDGYKTFKCSTCTATKDEPIEKLGHSYSTTTVQPTCTKNGYFHHVCKKCGYSYDSGNLPALGHDYVTEITRKLSCTEPGIETTRCTRSGCTAGWQDSFGTPPGHYYSEFISTVEEATCVGKGKAKYGCSRCNATSTLDTPALGHDEIEKTTPATCTTPPVVYSVCERCGIRTSQTKTDGSILGHNFTEFISTEEEATCLAMGKAKYKCSRCDETSIRDTPALGHDDKEIRNPATCTTPPVVYSECERCGIRTSQTKTDGSILGHNYTEFISTEEEATCLAMGKAKYKCSRCDETSILDTPALGHDEIERTTLATCKNPATSYRECERCGILTTDIKTIGYPLGHDVFCVSEIVSPTCSVEGRGVFQCRRCNYNYEGSIDTIPHTLNIQVDYREPTCAEEGMVRLQCTGCMYNEEQSIPKVPCAESSWEEVGLRQAQTCVLPELVVRKCKVCGNVDESFQSKPSLGGHTFPDFTYDLTDYEADLLESDYNFLNSGYTGIGGFEGTGPECSVCGLTLESFRFEVTSGCPDVKFDAEGTPLTNNYDLGNGTSHISGKEQYVDISCNYPVIITPNEEFVTLRSDSASARSDGSIRLPAGNSRLYIGVEELTAEYLMDNIDGDKWELIDSGCVRSASLSVAIVVEGKCGIRVSNDVFDFGVSQVLPEPNGMCIENYIESISSVIDRYGDNMEAMAMMFGLDRHEGMDMFSEGGTNLVIYAPASGSEQIHYIEYYSRLTQDKYVIEVLNGHNMSINPDISFSGCTVDIENIVSNSYDYVTNTTVDTVTWAYDTIKTFLGWNGKTLIEILESITEDETKKFIGEMLNISDVLSIPEEYLKYLVIQYFTSGDTVDIIQIDEDDLYVFRDYTSISLPEGCYLDARTRNASRIEIPISSDYRIDLTESFIFVAYMDVSDIPGQSFLCSSHYGNSRRLYSGNVFVYNTFYY